jgi:hypothetical protein
MTAYKRTANGLPVDCYAQIDGKTVYIQRGLKPAELRVCLSQNSIDDLNALKGVSKAQLAAMIGGITKGWDSAAADPKNYDDAGAGLQTAQTPIGGERTRS